MDRAAERRSADGGPLVGRRLVATAIDTVILAVVVLTIVVPLFYAVSRDDEDDDSEGAILLLAPYLGIAIFSYVIAVMDIAPRL